MKKLLLLAVLGIILTSAIAQTPVATKKQTGCKLKIGDTYAGGIIFYLNPDNACHGLVCAPHDQSAYIQWDDAFIMCQTLKINGYSHWRLPSPDELNQMFMNLYQVGLGHFDTKFYWSSTEQFSGASALGQVFAERSMGGGQRYGAGKKNACALRAIRAF